MENFTMGIVWEGHADILESTSQTLVVPINTAGAMGKGLALAFKERYPEMYAAYVRDCNANLLWERGYFLHRFTDAASGAERLIYGFPTKRHWKDASRLEWIQRGLIRLLEVYKQEGIRQLAVPALGCGEGKLLWPEVYSLMTPYLDHMDAEVGIYLPWSGKSSH